MDAALRELQEGNPNEEIEAVVRLDPSAMPPPHLRLIARFGDIATCRLPRKRITETWADGAVLSLKGSRPFGIDPEPLYDAVEAAEPEHPNDELRPFDIDETGEGVVIAVLDWGLDFAHAHFRNEDGSTRLLALWDQSSQLPPHPAPYGYGRVHSREEINAALRTDDPYGTLGYHPASGDPVGRGAHGTHVCSIAAGIAPHADLLFVHLATRGTEGRASLGDSVTLLEGLDWVRAQAGSTPWVANLSVGRHGASHDGRTLVEQGLDALLLERAGRCVVQSAGNYYLADAHAGGQLRPAQQCTLHWVTDQADVTPNELEVWYSGMDVFGFTIETPTGTIFHAPLGSETSITIDSVEIGRVYHRSNEPNTGDNHIDVFLYAEAPAGIWRVVLTADDIVNGGWDAWVERDAGCPSCQSRFVPDDAERTTTTGTICNGLRTIAVGAYDAHDPDRPLARFSSSGPTRRDRRVKPELLAPGVSVLAARSAPATGSLGDGALVRQSGTSMAAPHVTGTVALMFEAASVPLTIQQTRHLLMGAALPVSDAVAASDGRRTGSGYLDIAAAVQAARPSRQMSHVHASEEVFAMAGGTGGGISYGVDQWKPLATPGAGAVSYEAEPRKPFTVDPTTAIPAAAELTALLDEWRKVFGAQNPMGTTPMEIRRYVEQLLASLPRGSGTADTNIAMAHYASRNTFPAFVVGMLYIPTAVSNFAKALWEMVGLNLETKTGPGFRKTLTLPAPGRGRKYLIVSDLHRDRKSDTLKPFAVGSIDHFKANAALYCRILDYAFGKQYTLIEAGDCEELWFIRDPDEFDDPNSKGETRVAKVLREIIETYSVPSSDVYGKLRKLHAAGRYYRVFGNHDSFLRDPKIFQILKTEMEKKNSRPFEIHDAFIIPGVKTMLEGHIFDLIADVANAVSARSIKQLEDKLLNGRLGLDANDYKDTCKMIVTHGHQFDFWNCDQNQMLGLILSNTIGTFVDQNMDPFLDLQGLAWQGNPVFEFGDLFATLPLLNCWPTREAAVRMAHEIQHRENRERQLVDSIWYKESLAALFGTFALSVNAGTVDKPITPEASLKELSFTDPRQLLEYVRRHHGHHLCIGHTHHPQSQPFISIDNLSNLIPPVAPLVNAAKRLAPFELSLKSGYFNSGTGGWMEGVVWAVEIDESGQARLVYWTDNSVGPEYMDWELQPLAPEIKKELYEGLRQAIPNLLKSTSEFALDDFYKKLIESLSRFNIKADEIKQKILQRFSIPIAALGLRLAPTAPRSRASYTLPTGSGPNVLPTQLDRIRSFVFDVVLTARQRSLTSSVNPTETFVLTAGLPAAQRSKLLTLQRLFDAMPNVTSTHSLYYAAIALSASDEFPRRWRGTRTSDGLQGLLSVLPYFPPSQSVAEGQDGQDTISSRFELAGEGVRLTVTLSRSAARIA